MLFLSRYHYTASMGGKSIQKDLHNYQNRLLKTKWRLTNLFFSQANIEFNPIRFNQTVIFLGRIDKQYTGES